MLSPLPPISRKHRPITSFASDSCAAHPLQMRAQRKRRSTTTRMTQGHGTARSTGAAAGQGTQKRCAGAAQRAVAWRQTEQTRTNSTCMRYESSSAASEEETSPLCRSESFSPSARPPVYVSPRRQRQRHRAAGRRGSGGAQQRERRPARTCATLSRLNAISFASMSASSVRARRRSSSHSSICNS